MSRKPPIDNVIHGPGAAWSRDELGDDFDVSALSVIGELDPTGVNGVLEEVLGMFGESLDPLLSKLDRLRATGSASGVMFEAHKLKSAAGQLGALRLSTACADVLKLFDSDAPTEVAGALSGELDALLDVMMAETIRVQRKVRRLLAP
ncbi:MAG: Hpt domain-containing protein [Caldimonas sp.]